MKDEVEKVLSILPFDLKFQEDHFLHHNYYHVIIDNEFLSIPYRIYCEEPNQDDENILTNKQKIILNCIYSRHHNGYIRHKRLKEISSNEYWITPFKIQLLGEYVYEIIEELYLQLNDLNLENYQNLIIENPSFFLKIESKVISYWNEYYRIRFTNYNEYLGSKILKLIKSKKN